MSRSILWLVLPIGILSASILSAQSQENRVIPTIPETQIAPAEVSSPYEFLSVATSADEFVVKSAAMAEAKSTDTNIRALAQQLAQAHAAAMRASQAAGKADKVDIAEPSVDGEQQGLLSKMEALEGSEFDRAFIQSQIFVYQRSIAYYRGYAGQQDQLGAFAKETLPQLVSRYAELLKAAEQAGVGSTEQTPVAN